MGSGLGLGLGLGVGIGVEVGLAGAITLTAVPPAVGPHEGESATGAGGSTKA